MKRPQLSGDKSQELFPESSSACWGNSLEILHSGQSCIHGAVQVPSPQSHWAKPGGLWGLAQMPLCASLLWKPARKYLYPVWDVVWTGSTPASPSPWPHWIQLWEGNPFVPNFHASCPICHNNNFQALQHPGSTNLSVLYQSKQFHRQNLLLASPQSLLTEKWWMWYITTTLLGHLLSCWAPAEWCWGAQGRDSCFAAIQGTSRRHPVITSWH